MKKILNKKNGITILFFLIIDIIYIGCWIWYFKPSEDMSIVLMFAIPIIFMINFFIAGIFYFIKKYYTPFFILNAFISSFMLFFFFICYIEMDRKKCYESWTFAIESKNYNMSYSEKDTAYYVKVNYGDGFEQGCDRGIVKVKNDTVHFFSIDSTQYYIYKDYLYNFKGIEKIRIRKEY